MEPIKPEKIQKPKPAGTSNVSLRVKRDTKRRVLQELAKMNKKDFGRSIKADDLIMLALSLIEPRHISLLQEATLSNADRLELMYREHVKKYGATSKDEFLGQLIEERVNKEGLESVTDSIKKN